MNMINIYVVDMKSNKGSTCGRRRQTTLPCRFLVDCQNMNMHGLYISAQLENEDVEPIRIKKKTGEDDG